MSSGIVPLHGVGLVLQRSIRISSEGFEASPTEEAPTAVQPRTLPHRARPRR